MKPIPAAVVERTWHAQAQMNDEQLQKIVKQFSASQPLLFNYLMVVGDTILNVHDTELLFYLGACVWQMLQSGEDQPTRVTADILDAEEEKNYKMLEYLEGELEAEFYEVVSKMTAGYNQPEVLRYVIEALIESDQEVRPRIKAENLGQIYVCLKIIIDCLDR